MYSIRHILYLAGGTYIWRHIKGLQDDIAGAVLDHWAIFNIQMDMEATFFRVTALTTVVSDGSDRIHGEPGVFRIYNEKIVVDLKLRLLSYLSSITAIPYWESHFKWEPGSGQGINWAAIGYF